MIFNGTYFVLERGEQIDLWNPDIEWHDCPKGLPSAVELVEPLIAEREYLEPDPYNRENFNNYVFVSGEFVYGSDGIRKSRARLQNQAPFDMGIYHNTYEGILYTMRYYNEIPIKVARLDMYAVSGIAFDFGKFRAWSISLIDSSEKNSFVDYNELFEKSKIVDLMEISDELSNIVEDANQNTPRNFFQSDSGTLTFSIKNSELKIILETEENILAKKYRITSDCLVNSISFKVEPITFFKIFRRGSSMAIATRPELVDDLLYIREDEQKCEHFLLCEILDLKVKT